MLFISVCVIWLLCLGLMFVTMRFGCKEKNIKHIAQLLCWISITAPVLMALIYIK